MNMLTDGNALMNERLNSLLNNSTTKQAYSFGKAIRFKVVDKKDNSYHFYNIPELKSTRSTTLGYGKKSYSQIIGCGSNQLVAAPSYFDPQKHNAPVYSFGVSRPKKRREDNTPGPIYNITKKFGEGIPSYIFGTSGLKKRKIERSASLPGPGEYYNEKNHRLSSSCSSSLINSAKIVIGKEKRFKIDKKDRTPGPGQYNIPGLINNTGMINYNSKYLSIPAKSFLGKRNDYSLRKQDSSPGPGSYNFFSIFEGYSREKMPKINNN